MASSKEFAEYVAEQLSGAGRITYRKMFGEYGVYCDGKFFALICDDRLLIKITDEVKKKYPNIKEAPPYDGAKNYFLIEEIDDREFLTDISLITFESLPEKNLKPQKKVKGKENMAKQEKFDYKKAYKDLYLPKKTPNIIDIPEMIFISVEGSGDPNTSKEYKEAMEILYGLSFTIKMSKMDGSEPAGYFDYVVPPLEGVWWMEDKNGKIDYNNKDKFCWIAMIRQPEFVTESVFNDAKEKLNKKKPELNLEKAEYKKWSEGLCCQIMHVGPYDDEPETIEKMEKFIFENGYNVDETDGRYHHEIYLSDPRRAKKENLKTVIRLPVKNG